MARIGYLGPTAYAGLGRALCGVLKTCGLKEDSYSE